MKNGQFWVGWYLNEILKMQRFLDISRFLYSVGWQVWNTVVEWKKRNNIVSWEETRENMFINQWQNAKYNPNLTGKSGKRGTVEPRLSGPRLSGLFDYPDFLLWSQFFNEYYRKRSCISRTFLHKTQAKNQGCGLSTDTSVFGVLKNLINIHKTS